MLLHAGGKFGRDMLYPSAGSLTSPLEILRVGTCPRSDRHLSHSPLSVFLSSLPLD